MIQETQAAITWALCFLSDWKRQNSWKMMSIEDFKSWLNDQIIPYVLENADTGIPFSKCNFLVSYLVDRGHLTFMHSIRFQAEWAWKISWNQDVYVVVYRNIVICFTQDQLTLTRDFFRQQAVGRVYLTTEKALNYSEVFPLPLNLPDDEQVTSVLRSFGLLGVMMRQRLQFLTMPCDPPAKTEIIDVAHVPHFTIIRMEPSPVILLSGKLF